jgi:hypothetical protein
VVALGHIHTYMSVCLVVKREERRRGDELSHGSTEVRSKSPVQPGGPTILLVWRLCIFSFSLG